MTDFTVPTWIITSMPVLVFILTWLGRKLPPIANIGPRNLGAIVAMVLAAAVVAHEDPTLACTGDIIVCVTSIVSLVLYWWKGAQLIADLFSDQLRTPDGHARQGEW